MSHIFEKTNSAPVCTSSPSPLQWENTALTKFSRLCLGLFGWIFLLFFFWLFLSLCFANNSTFTYTFWKQSLSAVLITTATVLGYLSIERLAQRKKSIRALLTNRFLRIFILGMTLIFICQLIYILLATTGIGWDAGVLVQYAKSPAMGTDIDYFKHYPNNLFLLFFFRFFVLVFHFFKTPGVWGGLNVINAIAIDIAIILTVLTARRLFRLRGAYISWFFSIITIAFFPYLIVPYSDTLAMPFVAAIFYLYFRIRDSRHAKESIYCALSMGVCACIGSLIKPTVLIPLFAVVLIHFIFTLKNRKRLFKSAGLFLLVMILFLVSNQCYQAFANEHFPKKAEMETPMTHFAMMGLHQSDLPNGTSMYGAFYRPDVNKTFSLKGKDRMIEYHLVTIEKRLKEFGFSGYMEFLNNKARWITSEGNFFWGGEGNFADFDWMDESFVKELINSGPNDLGLYTHTELAPQGKLFDVYFYFSQGVWILLLLLTTIPLFLREKGNYNCGITILRCSVFGLMLFLLLFEARSRYLINQLPVFILLASFGFLSLNKQIKSWKKRKKQS